MTAMPKPQILSLTDRAAARVRVLLDRRNAGVLRIGVDAKGCSGLSYKLEFVTEPDPRDEVVRDKGAEIYVDPGAVLYLIGSEMDYTEDKLESGFTFRNPNEKSCCGCGESFHV